MKRYVTKSDFLTTFLTVQETEYTSGYSRVFSEIINKNFPQLGCGNSLLTSLKGVKRSCDFSYKHNAATSLR